MARLCRTVSLRRAFTLVEMLASAVILLIVFLLITTVVQHTARAWRSGGDQHRSFHEAQRAFGALSRNLEQATLNTYWTTLDASLQPLTAANEPTFTPAFYGRMSELHFVAGPAAALLGTAYGPGSAVFFQTPLGFSRAPAYAKLQDTLNVCGYFVKFGDDTAEMPAMAQPLVKPRYRYRLMELLQPTENLGTYHDQTSASAQDWFTTPAATTAARPIAENVILMVIRWIYPRPDGTLAYTYAYNSREGGTGTQPITQHQLPPRAELTLVALDETSAQRAQEAAGTTAPDLVASGLFTDPEKLPADLAALESSLASKGYRFRVFASEIFLKGAKWSTL
jgi:uncharacterized protein (TIGR02599 family)